MKRRLLKAFAAIASSSLLAGATVLAYEAHRLAVPVVLRAHKAEVWCVAFSADGRTVLTGGEDREAHLWSRDGAHLGILPGHERGVICGTFAGALVVTGGKDEGIVRSWSLADQHLVRSTPPRQIQDITASADGSLLAISGNWITELRRTDGRFVRFLSDGEAGGAVAFVGSDRLVVTAHGDWTTVWDTTTGARRTHSKHENACGWPALARGRGLVARGYEDRIEVRSVFANALVATIPAEVPSSPMIALDDEGDVIAWLKRDGSVQIASPDGRLLRTIVPPRRAQDRSPLGRRAFALSPDGSTLGLAVENEVFLYALR